MHEHQRETREGGDRSRDVADEEQLGFVRVAPAEVSLEGNAARRQRMPDGATYVESPGAAGPPFHRQSRCKLSRQRANRPAHLRDLVARRTHEIEIFGQRAHCVARNLIRTPVLGEPAADFRLDFLTKRAQPLLDLVTPHPFFERPHPPPGSVFHQPSEHLLEIDHAVDTVLEVRAAGLRTLHAPELRNGAPREVAYRRRVAGQQRLEQLLEIIVGRQRLVVGVALLECLGAAAGAEVQIEQHVERRTVRRALDHRRRERSSHRFALDQGHFPQRSKPCPR